MKTNMKTKFFWKDSKGDPGIKGSETNKTNENILCNKCEQCEYAFKPKNPEPKLKRPVAIGLWNEGHVFCEPCGVALDVEPRETYFVLVLEGLEMNYCRRCLIEKYAEAINHYNIFTGSRRFNRTSENIKRGA